jgi:hypothetical protein
VEDGNARDFFAALGFEEIEIEDGLTALCCETDEAGGYALVTDDGGAVPENLKQAVVFACYTPEGGVHVERRLQARVCVPRRVGEAATVAEKVDAVRKRREEAYK